MYALLRPIAFALLCCVSPALAPAEETLIDPPKIDDLNSLASRVSLDASDRTVAEILRSVERQTGNAVSIAGANLGEMKDRRIDLQVERVPFWEAIGGIEQQSGASFRELDGDAVVLDEEGTVFDSYEPLAEPAVVGPFRLKLVYHPVFDKLHVLVETEPKFGWPEFRRYQFLVERRGERYRYETARDLLIFDVHTHRFTPGAKLDHLKRESPEGSRGDKALSLPEDVESLDRVGFDAELKLAASWKEFDLPPLKEIAAEPFALGPGEVQVRSISKSTSGDGASAWRIVVAFEGLPLKVGASTLIDAEGVVHDPEGSGTVTPTDSDSRGSLTLRFPAEEIAEPLARATLILRGDSGDQEWRIENLATRAPKPQKLGATTVHVSSAEIEEDGDLDVDLFIEGLHPRIESALLISGDEAIKPSRRSGVRSHFGLGFPADDLPDHPLQSRLRIEAPGDAAALRLTHVWKDVRLSRAEPVDE